MDHFSKTLLSLNLIEGGLIVSLHLVQHILTGFLTNDLVHPSYDRLHLLVVDDEFSDQFVRTYHGDTHDFELFVDHF